MVCIRPSQKRLIFPLLAICFTIPNGQNHSCSYFITPNVEALHSSLHTLPSLQKQPLHKIFTICLRFDGSSFKRNLTFCIHFEHSSSREKGQNHHGATQTKTICPQENISNLATCNLFNSPNLKKLDEVALYRPEACRPWADGACYYCRFAYKILVHAAAFSQAIVDPENTGVICLCFHLEKDLFY